MPNTIKRRLVTINDAETLYQWRTDSITVKESLTRESFSYKSHIAWLDSALRNSDIHLFIYVDHMGIAVGTGRAEHHDSCFRLSWTVAPEARGHGIGTEIVCDLVSQFKPCQAEIREGNEASIRIANHAGLREVRRIAGIIHFESL